MNNNSEAPVTDQSEGQKDHDANKLKEVPLPEDLKAKFKTFGSKSLTKSTESKYGIKAKQNKKLENSENPKIGPGVSKSASQTLAGKSKLPTLTREPSEKSNLKNKTVTSAQPSKISIPKNQGLKKPPEVKPIDLKRSNPKTTDRKMASSFSRASFVTTTTTAADEAPESHKVQSARTSSLLPVLGANKRSVSNASMRTLPSPKKKEVFNLRKMRSTAGDHKNYETTSELETENSFEPTEDNLETTEVIQMIENLQIKPNDAKRVQDFKEEFNMQMNQWFSAVRSELKENNEMELADVEEKLEHSQILKAHGILALIDDFCAATFKGYNLQESKLKKELEDLKQSVKKDGMKYDNLIKLQEEERIKLKGNEEKALKDMIKKEDEMKEFQKKLKSQEKQISNLKSAKAQAEKDRDTLQADKDHLQEELKSSKENLTANNKKLHTLEQQLSQERLELKAKNDAIKNLEEELMEKEMLKMDLKEITTKFEEFQIKAKTQDCELHSKQISELKQKLQALEAQKEESERQNANMEKQILELHKKQEKLSEVEQKLKESEQKLKELQEQNEINLKACEASSTSKESLLEISKLRQSENEKRREIEKLKMELSKAQFNICQLEQQIQRDQQLLEVRAELINSLQSNEKTHRVHVEELFAQVGEKNNTVNELNAELQTKSEEYRNLFTSLSAKQIEVANQEHIIKLLEESNERSHLLRVKQEEKIRRMEEEVVHLKQTIAMYQGSLLTANRGKHLLFAPVLPASNGDYNENFYYYLSQRKRKRQVDINVKKYEA